MARIDHRNLGEVDQTHRKVSSSRPVAIEQAISRHRRLLSVEHPKSHFRLLLRHSLVHFPRIVIQTAGLSFGKADFEAIDPPEDLRLSCRNGSWKRKCEKEAVGKGQGVGQETCRRSQVHGYPDWCTRVSWVLPKVFNQAAHTA